MTAAPGKPRSGRPCPICRRPFRRVATTQPKDDPLVVRRTYQHEAGECWEDHEPNVTEAIAVGMSGCLPTLRPKGAGG